MKMNFSKKGDMGETSLLGNQRVPKFDLRPETYGTIDEASSVLGVARGITDNVTIKDIILQVQKDLLVMGAEMSTPVEEIWRLNKRIEATDVEKIEDIIDELQVGVVISPEFIYPGKNAISAQIDVGRTVIRRAERRTVELKDHNLLNNPNIHKYMNRLADMLFVLARYAEERG
jgi:cob(I)alamin adenosyltransferase